MPPSIEHLQTEKSKEIIVAVDRAPAFVRMMIQHRQTHLLQRALVVGREPGVINDPVRCALSVSQRFSDKNHYVIRKLLDPRLVEEEKVATLGSSAIAAYKCAVEILEGARIGEVRKLSACYIALLKRAKFGSK